MPPRPQQHYRQRLLAELARLRPARALEVGCGGGAFLRAAAQAGIGIEGLDPDPAAVAALGAEGLVATPGVAEFLPWPDGAFDVVVFCYTAHHLADWSRALAEALRVADRAVLVLDPWYDAGLPSQLVALDFDRWAKAIDRSAGLVHNDCMDAAALLEPLQGAPHQLSAAVEYLLHLHELGPEQLRALGEAHLRGMSAPQRWQPALDELVRRAEREGFSDDGAVLLSLARE